MRGSKARQRKSRGSPAPANSKIKSSPLTKQNRTEKPRDGGPRTNLPKQTRPSGKKIGDDSCELRTDPGFIG